MKPNARMLFVHALSPLHAGTGQGVGVIDLPVARAGATGLPYLPGSSLKGALRDRCGDAQARRAVFGPDTAEAYDHAGAAQFSDQRLLLLPIRSLYGTFAWVTSPYVLRRLRRDASGAGMSGLPVDVPSPSSVEEACVVVDGDRAIEGGGEVVLQDLDLKPEPSADAATWADWIGRGVFADEDWRAELARRFCVVHDDVLGFLLETATEITARIRLEEESKTVTRGGLWYEEALPTETVLSGLLAATPVAKGNATSESVFETLAGLVSSPVQLGGKSTVGRGVCSLRIAGAEG